MNIRTHVDLDAGWGLSESLFRAIKNKLSGSVTRTVIEFGSGGSTLRMLETFPAATIISFEHDQQWISYAREQLQHYNSNRIQLNFAPLKWQSFLGAPYLTYNLADAQIPVSADMLLIDGPPYYTLRGREACLYVAHSHITIGGRVFLDDAQRPWEQQIIANWKATAGHCYEFEVLAGERKNMMMLTKHNDAPLRPSASVKKDARTCRREIRKNRFRERLGKWKKRLGL